MAVDGVVGDEVLTVGLKVRQEGVGGGGVQPIHDEVGVGVSHE